MKTDEWMYGKPGVKYGVYNNRKKEFQFGISEDTPLLAKAKLFSKIGDDARRWRFEIREIKEDK